jgi:hypothetical protein
MRNCIECTTEFRPDYPEQQVCIECQRKDYNEIVEWMGVGHE